MMQRRSRNLLLAVAYLAGLALALYCESHELHLIFSISLSFTNVILLLLLRCYGNAYGLAAAILVYGVSIFMLGRPYIVLLSLLEIIAIGLSLKWSKRDRMLRTDALFWMVIGIPAIFLAYWTMYRTVSMELWLLITISATNGLFNVMFADIIWKYLPKRWLKPGISFRIEPLFFSKVLFHIIIVSIALPFLIFILNNSWSSYASVSQYSYKLATSAASSISKELSALQQMKSEPLSTEDYRIYIQELTQQPVSDGYYQIAIIDHNNSIIASSHTPIPLESSHHYDIDPPHTSSKHEFYMNVPAYESRIFPIQGWNEASYVYKIPLEIQSSEALQLFVYVPMKHDQELIYKQFLIQFLSLLLFVICGSTIGQWLNHRLLRGLTQLATLTTDLPDKLYTVQKIKWPESSIYEIRSLIHNFKYMSGNLIHMFQNSLKNTRLLEEQTTRLIKSEKKLHHLAYYDELTGLPNRLHFQEYIKTLGLDKPIDETPEDSPAFAIMFADLNRFKQVNDTLGHAIGNELLHDIAQRFSRIISEQCKVFRLSGDEFLFILHYEHISDVQQIAQTICDICEEPFEINGRALYMSVSVGISVYPYDGDDIDAVMRNADIAMYVAKEQGDGLYHFYDSLIENQREENMRLENELKAALLEGQFKLYYQPKIDASSGEVIGAEALIRWLHPEYGMVSPAKFIPLAENSGVILDIDEWVLQEACRQNKIWQLEGMPRFPVAVNISARHFYQSNLIPTITRILHETGLEPQYLLLEITEGTLIRNVEYGVRMMEDLKKMGIHISMDDFGTGYSSLSQLDRLPISEMKLDRSFIQGITEDSRKSSIVRAVIELGHHMDLRVVAEGIESPDELKYLTDLECDQFQGYLFSKPLPELEFSRFVLRWDGSSMPVDGSASAG